MQVSGFRIYFLEPGYFFSKILSEFRKKIVALQINIEKLPADLKEIVIFTLIYDGNKYGQTFGEVKNFFLQLKDSDNEKVIYRNDSDVYEEEASKHSAYVLGKIKKDADSWKFIPQHRFSDENTEQDLVDNL